jgi:alpha-D-ribose 1-methylphosphonate 5-triphosphate synthase subunit PhnL
MSADAMHNPHSDNAYAPRLVLRGVGKTFHLHQQRETVLPVVSDVALSLDPGECVVLAGPSGAGKSSLLRLIYGNYRASAGEILVRTENGPVDVATAPPRTLLAMRRETIGYVSQFLRVIPRIPTRDLVAEPLLARGIDKETARARAEGLLARLNIPHGHLDLPPATFSGGEQQRVNIARGFAAPFPLLLLDEPTASLDRDNRMVVADLINEAKADGAAILGIFHDADMRDRVADRLVDIRDFAADAHAA